MGDREPRPEQQLVGARRQLGGAPVQRAGLVGAARRPSARRRRRPARRRARARAAARARPSGSSWSSTRRSTRARHASPSGGTTSSAADWRPRTSPPSPCGRLQRRQQPRGEVAGGGLERRRHRGRHGVALHHVRLAAPRGAGRVAGVGDAVRAGGDRHAAARVDDRRPGARVRSASAASSASSASARGLAALHPVERVRAVRGLDHRLRGDRADARARPGAERADAEPVRLDRRAELAGVGVEGDDRVGAVAHGARGYPRCRSARGPRAGPHPEHAGGLRARLRRRLPGRPALRRHGAGGQRRPRPAVVADRARRRLARQRRPPARAAGGGGDPVPRRARRHARARRGCRD